jgi:hypothetical protein
MLMVIISSVLIDVDRRVSAERVVRRSAGPLESSESKNDPLLAR